MKQYLINKLSPVFMGVIQGIKALSSLIGDPTFL